MSFDNLPKPNYPSNYDNEDIISPPSQAYLPYPNEQQSIIDYIVKMRNSIIALETSLGTNPFGIQTTVAKRLDLLENVYGQLSGSTKSVHRIQIADDHPITSVVEQEICIGQIGINLYEECDISNTSSVVEAFFRAHVQTDPNLVLTLRLYKINEGVSTLITSFTFNDSSPYSGGSFTKQIQLDLVSQLPVDSTILELRAVQAHGTPSAVTDDKSIMWDASLIIQMSNNDDGYMPANVNGRYVNPTSDDLIVWKFDDASTIPFYSFVNSGTLGASADLALPYINNNYVGTAHNPEFMGIFNNGAMLSGNTMYTQTVCANPSNITISMWINLFETIQPNTFIAIQKLDANSNVVFGIKTDYNNGLCFEYLGTDGLTHSYNAPLHINSTNSWMFIGFVFDGTHVYISVNGNYVLADPTGVEIKYAGPLNAGNGKWAIINSNVIIDDLRIAQIARDEHWFKCVYKLGINQYP